MDTMWKEIQNVIEKYTCSQIASIDGEKYISKYEQDLAEFFDVEYAISISSGTAAIHCALAALDIGPGDEVLVPSLSVVMSVVPIIYLGATPVFIDKDENYIDFNYADLERKITSRTKAILPVYLWGYSYNLNKLKEFANKYNLFIIEDACQAHGSQWNERYLGTWGDFGCFSTKDGKMISTGEGGFLLTNDENLFRKCRLIRGHWTDFYDKENHYSRLAYNYRLSAVQALIGIMQLQSLKDRLEKRKALIPYLLSLLKQSNDFTLYAHYKEETPNFYSPLILLEKSFSDKPIAEILSTENVPNSVGTFGLKSVYQWKSIKKEIFSSDSELPPSLNTDTFLRLAIAPTLMPSDDNEKIEYIIKQMNNVITHLEKQGDPI